MDITTKLLSYLVHCELITETARPSLLPFMRQACDYLREHEDTFLSESSFIAECDRLTAEALLASSRAKAAGADSEALDHVRVLHELTVIRSGVTYFLNPPADIHAND